MSLSELAPPVVIAPTRRRVTEGRGTFALAALTYLTIAAYLVLERHALWGDALSRVANAQYVLSSRDPHLAAIGFVWNPLPSLLIVPFVPLRGVFPTAFATGFPAAIESALFMAAAVALVRGVLADLGVGRLPRWLLTLAFAAHPMIVVYATNGMSEAPLLCFTLLAARWLLRWLRDGSPQALVVTGGALALGYLTRYEAMASGAAVIILVVLVTLWRTPGPWLVRRTAAVADAAVVGLPFLFAFGLWAVLSKVIVNQWFPTLSSQYGNTAQVGAQREFIEAVIGTTTSARLTYVGEQLVGLQPAAVVVLVLAALLAALRRSPLLLGLVATMGAVLTFDAAATVTDRSFGWLRFQIAVIPLAVLLAGVVIAHAGRRLVLRSAAALVCVALVTPAVVTSVDTLFDRRLGREEARILTAVVRPRTANLAEIDERRRFELGAQMAADIDRLRLPDGAVVTDVANSFAVLLASRRTSTFVITPDQDFERILADPVRFGAQYLLVPSGGSGGADAVVTAYPDLYERGLPGGALVREWPAASGYASWRLWALPRPAAP